MTQITPLSFVGEKLAFNRPHEVATFRYLAPRDESKPPSLPTPGARKVLSYETTRLIHMDRHSEAATVEDFRDVVPPRERLNQPASRLISERVEKSSKCFRYASRKMGSIRAYTPAARSSGSTVSS